MWRTNDEGLVCWYNDVGYVMSTTASTGAWGTLSTWTERDMKSEAIYPSGEWKFNPKPKCIFDEK